MTDDYLKLTNCLKTKPRQWLITGVAGFIGSHLLQELLGLGQSVVGVDNLSTGRMENLDNVRLLVSESDWQRFSFIEGDITENGVCKGLCQNVDFVLHQAALGSVPRSLKDPMATHRANVDGSLEVLLAARDRGVQRVVYASSSSVYGDSRQLPQVENTVGSPLSPYAVSKATVELYAPVFTREFGISTVGLRYFNVFGPRQNPAGAYAAVIPRWINSLLNGEECRIFGDGETSRDFSYVANVVQANLLAALSENPDVSGEIFNIAVGEQTSLLRLYDEICRALTEMSSRSFPAAAKLVDFRAGDIRHSFADIQKARKMLGYEPSHALSAGIQETVRSVFG